MLRKRKTRELAMQSLFLWDTNRERDVDLARPIVDEGTDDPDIRTPNKPAPKRKTTKPRKRRTK